MLLDFLKCANEAGFPIGEYRYVGMGGTMFYDFHLVHRFSGIKSMVSLERDPETHPRCKFNCPFDFIRVLNLPVADFLAKDKFKKKTIYWFDYDDGIGPDITADIISLGSVLKVGGFAFITVFAKPPGALETQTTQERLDYFQQEMAEFAVGMTPNDMENDTFPDTIHRLLVAAFHAAFAARAEGKFYPLFQVRYKDSSPMITVGGVFCSDADASRIVTRMHGDMPFLAPPEPYKIRSLNLTERERALFDIAVTKKTLNSRQAKSLRRLGFRKREFDSYRDLLRFWPRYHESII